MTEKYFCMSWGDLPWLDETYMDMMSHGIEKPRVGHKTLAEAIKHAAGRSCDSIVTVVM